MSPRPTLFADCLARLRNPITATALALIGILFIWLRLNNFNVPLTRDEAEYAYATQAWRHGMIPYEHAFVQKPPMVIYTYGVSELIAPGVYWLPRIIAAAFVGIVTLLLGYTVALEFGGMVGLTAMLFLTPIVLLPEVQQFTANTEMFMLLPVVALVTIAVCNLHGRMGDRAWFLAGIFGAFAIWYKYTAAPLVGTLFVAWLLRDYLQSRTTHSLFRKVTLILLGGLGISIPILLPFLVSDGGKRLWECTVQFNRYYAAAQPFGMSGLVYNLKLFWADWWLMFLLPLALLYKPHRVVWFWSVLFVAAWVGTGGSIYGHYYIVVMPFWATLAAVGIQRIAKWFATAVSANEAAASSAIALLVTLVLCLSHVPWITRSREEFAQGKLAGGNPFIEAVSAGARIASITTPKDFVFVAGSEPEIYYYAQRLNPSRFITMYPLMIPTVLAPVYQQELIHIIERQPPKVIVFARSNTSWLKQEQTPGLFLDSLIKLLTQKYDCVAGYVLDGQSGHWVENLSADDIGNATLVLYQLRPG